MFILEIGPQEKSEAQNVLVLQISDLSVDSEWEQAT